MAAVALITQLPLLLPMLLLLLLLLLQPFHLQPLPSRHLHSMRLPSMLHQQPLLPIPVPMQHLLPHRVHPRKGGRQDVVNKEQPTLALIKLATTFPQLLAPPRTIY